MLPAAEISSTKFFLALLLIFRMIKDSSGDIVSKARSIGHGCRNLIDRLSNMGRFNHHITTFFLFCRSFSFPNKRGWSKLVYTFVLRRKTEEYHIFGSEKLKL
jgi:hypothetical protein